MAYQARQRDPFLDSDMQAAIEQRGKELFGLALLAFGVLVTLMLASYVPEDPSWLSATDEPAQNWLGRFGASLASPLFVIVGFGAWAIPTVAIVWGLRFLLHRGEERAFSRLLFAPLAVAFASIYASSYVPLSDWTHSFGLGGLFGDTVLGALLGVLPINAVFGLKVIAALVFLALLVLSLYVLGCDKEELRTVARTVFIGVILLYASIAKLFGMASRGAARGTVMAAQKASAARAARKEARLTAETFEEPPIEGPALQSPLAVEPMAEEPAKTGLLARMPALVKRVTEPEPEPDQDEVMIHELDPEDRIKSRITDVIKNRARRVPVLEADTSQPMMRAEPQLTRGRGPDPLHISPVEPVEDAAIEEPVAASQPERQVYSPQPKAVVQQPVRKAPSPSSRAKAEAQPTLFDEKSDFELPPLNLLASPANVERHILSDEALEENARMLEAVLDDYGVKGEIVSVRPGPVVTMYELEPAPGLKASRVIGLADDIARSMSALSARVSTVPGRSVIGIELPNEKREMVVLREILASRDFGDGIQKLPLALGKDIGGESIVANLAKMPHLLIAGTTGSGKSVAINTMILSLLYKLTPEECRLIMIDPKMLELSVYDGIPHLLSPVVTDPKKAVVALKWVVGEMEERYRKMSKMGVRNIDGYNGRVKEALNKGEMFSRTVQTGFDDETGDPVFETEEFQPEAMPYIVVIVDEMADLMMVAGKEIEACIQRLAQMARASGIHLIMATQRPSVDVITGTIKANFPTRISFQVTSKIDSRTILGEMGAEQLLGMGDMLYMAGGSKITRVHGPFVSDEEVEEIVNHLKSFGPPEYMSGVVEGPDEEKSSDIDQVLGLGGNTDGEDALYDTAVQIVIKDRKCSTSYIQRKLAIGYNKAARLVEQMEEQGLVSPANHVGKREILVPEPQ
ncbi:MAG: DNA translocase FtsK 4TM domain-containing protein [Litoreibacter sp.]|nr:DNA translocase FtsK 4TM domain-containing protein [Litoreibacter sp.]